jgi:hypothetical protein
MCLLLSVVAGPAAAHGGGEPQLSNAEAGPYRVSAWTEPNPIRAGQLHVTVAVSQAPEPGADQGDVVLDAAVQVRLEPVGLAGEAVVAPATRENAVNKLLYEADMELPAEGRWQVTVEVAGPAGAGSAAFEIDALPSSTASGLRALPWPVWAGLGLMVLLAGGMVWAGRAQTAATAGRLAGRRPRTVDGPPRPPFGRRAGRGRQ